MKIGIDISSVIYETGVSYYTRNLVSSLIEIDKNNDYVLFGGSLRRKVEIDRFVKNLKSEKVIGKTYPIPPRLQSMLWNDLHIAPFELFSGKIDVYHSSDWAQAPTDAYKVTTVHDLVPIRFPEISHPQIVSTHKKRLERVRKEVDKIIAVSEFTKKELIDLYDIDEKKVTVVYEAPDSNLAKANKGQIEEIKGKYGIKGEYLLVVGADPRKNVPAIIQAFSLIKKSNPGMYLVITGRPWQEITYSESVLVLGHIPRNDLNILYSGAHALVYTSLYEGFGLPILEAMTVGCPVVTSNISSMPEVAGGAAVLVNPKEPPEIAEGIKEVLKNREKWSRKGIARAKEFSWQKTARETLEIYKEANKR